MDVISEYKVHDRIPVAVECVILGFDGKIRVWLMNIAESWCLPWGFVNNSAALDAVATGIVENLTGLSGIYVEQLYSFGETGNPGERIISIVYLALIRMDQLPERVMKKEGRWFVTVNLSKMGFDHGKKVKLARERLRQKTVRQIGYLLPGKFTLPQLKHLYETVHGKRVDTRNFFKKMRTDGIVMMLYEKAKTSKKGAFYYTFNDAKNTVRREESFCAKLRRLTGSSKSGV